MQLVEVKSEEGFPLPPTNVFYREFIGDTVDECVTAHKKRYGEAAVVYWKRMKKGVFCLFLVRMKDEGVD